MNLSFEAGCPKIHVTILEQFHNSEETDEHKRSTKRQLINTFTDVLSFVGDLENHRFFRVVPAWCNMVLSGDRLGSLLGDGFCGLGMRPGKGKNVYYHQPGWAPIWTLSTASGAGADGLWPVDTQ